MSTLIPDAVLFAFGAAAMTTLGLVCVLIWRETTRRQTGWFAGFAAGALITVAMLHLLPEAMEMSHAAPAYLLGGFAGAYFLNSGILLFDRNGNGGRIAQAGLMPLIAIGFHSFVDGIAYAVTFSVDFETGLVTVIGLIFHEVPEGIIIFVLLQRTGMADRYAFLLSFLGAALTTPLGAIAGTSVLSGIHEDKLGDLFAVTSGVLLYIGTSHLLPHVDKEPFPRKAMALILGGAIGIAANMFHASDHDHDNHPTHKQRSSR